MAEGILVLGKSGQGKTTSLRNLDPKTTMIIQGKRKRLPFPHKNWKQWDKDKQEGSIFFANTFDTIKIVLKKMEEVGKKVIILDDLVYVFAQKVMEDIDVKGYEKWTEISVLFNDVMNVIESMDSDIRVYILTHTDVDDDGYVKMKTAGKMIDNVLNPEGQFTVVLGTNKKDGKHFFITNGGNDDPFKTPMGMFKDKMIPNDLADVDKVMCNYWNIDTK